MRLFFGLGFSDPVIRQIDHWRDSNLPPFQKPVASSNLHMTLVFLGELNERDCDQLQWQAESVHTEAFELDLDQVGYWPAQQISYLAPGVTPPPLENLVAQLRQLARRCHLRVERKSFVPHVTLARRCEPEPPAPLVPPAITATCDGFSLFESVRLGRGVAYEVVSHYPLN